jgi:endoglycosylceramidase
MIMNPALAKIGINSESRQLIDEHGRAVLLHGVNVVYKVAPYIPSQGAFDSNDSLNAEDIANLKQWGMNFVRLGVMWEGVERERGVYDHEYLAKVDGLITKLGEAGIYTLVDAHQDVFARTICGEGVPDFYAKDVIGDSASCLGPLDKLLQPLYDKANICHNMEDYGYAQDENGDYLITDCQKNFFADYYTSPQSMKAFDALFSNKMNLQDKFVAFWDATSSYLTSNPYVVGFDPLNEPYPGNFLKDPSVMLPGNFDRNRLAPMYTRVFERYQKNDKDSIMFFEPGTFPDVISIAGGKILPVGFKTPPGGEIGSVNHVLNDHTYCCQMGSEVCATGEPSVDLAAECYEWHEKRIGTRKADADRLGVPLIISEFGACLTEAPCTQEIRQVCEVADEHLAGWAYWEFKNYEDLTTSAGTGSEGFYN